MSGFKTLSKNVLASPQVEAEDIAAAVAWLCSGAGVIFHGALIDADAGYTKGV